MSVKHKVFIDGAAGTTGLEIVERLQSRSEIEMILLGDADRKNPAVRRKAFEDAEVAILCLPDEAAAEVPALVEGLPVRLLDASTKHRTAAGWAYGIPELGPEFREGIRKAKNVSNPGCWASAFVLALRPLFTGGLLPGSFPITAGGVSGYSGGGKAMIAQFREAATAQADENLHFAAYSLELGHKHLPEMRKWAGLESEPVFLPSVDHFYRGMLVHIPLHRELLKSSGTDDRKILSALKGAYANEPFVRVKDFGEAALRPDGKLDARKLNGTNRVEIALLGKPGGHVSLAVTLDNLGKGASGAAVQNLNLMLGLPEASGLS